uniref:Uncharacterized protein n=2 Tax=Micrurus lemniscatus lemniscatus TaxID=129467 RepID=A0A2D4IE63_MICLE
MVDKAVPQNGSWSPVQAEGKRNGENIADKKASALALEIRVPDGGTELQKVSESILELKKRGNDEDNETKADCKRKSGFEGGGFLGRKKGPHLVCSPNIVEGSSEVFGTASPSPTKTTVSPRHKKSDSSCQDYTL